MTAGFSPPRILLIATGAQHARRLIEETNTSGRAIVEQVSSLPEPSALASGAIDAIVLDTGRPDGFDLGALDTLRSAAGDRIPIVVLINDGDDELAHDAMQRGAQDYVATDRADVDLLIRVVRYARERLEWRRESRRQEAELLQAQKMEAIGRLAGGVAHDFNNVLAAIFGYSDLLLEQFTVDDPRRADVQEIRRSAERAAGLTRQLLAFSRKQIMQPRLLNLNEVVASLQKLLARLVGEDITLDLRGEKDLWPVRADPGQMEQVLMNLAANARDAMPEGGRLTIETANVDVVPDARLRPGLQAGAYVMMTVSDNGSGVREEVRTHIFEPFFTTKDQGKGTGLGLATVYGIVKQSGGSVYVESEEERGTRFVIYLPRVPERAGS
jgi:two-component system, cell cycle sensor histidine kinase and response regulator CckA